MISSVAAAMQVKVHYVKFSEDMRTVLRAGKPSGFCCASKTFVLIL